MDMKYHRLHFLSLGMRAGGQSSPSPSHLHTVGLLSVLIIAELARGRRWSRNLEPNFCPGRDSNPEPHGLTTLCHNKDDQHRPPPSSRLGTGTVRVQTVMELHHTYTEPSTYTSSAASNGVQTRNSPADGRHAAPVRRRRRGRRRKRRRRRCLYF